MASSNLLSIEITVDELLAVSVSTTQFSVDIDVTASASSGTLYAAVFPEVATFDADDVIAPSGEIAANSQAVNAPGVQPTLSITVPDLDNNVFAVGIVWDDGSSRSTLYTDVVGYDITAPTISEIDVAQTYESATITWTTDEPATSQLDFGLTASYGQVANGSGYSTSHSIPLTGLTDAATYHFKITSADSGGNSVESADQTFYASGDFYIVNVDGDNTVYDNQENVAINCMDAGAVEGVVDYGEPGNRILQTGITWPATPSGASTITIAEIDSGSLSLGLYDLRVLKPKSIGQQPITASIAELASAIVANVATADMAASIAESATAIVANVASEGLAASIAESATAIVTNSAAADLAASIAESATAIVTNAAAADLVASIAESATTIDAMSAAVGGGNPYGDDMVLVFQTTAPDETITIPAGNTGTYNANIDWGDGDDTNAVIAYNDANLGPHAFTTPGEQIVRISGTFPYLYFNNSGDDTKLLRVLSMGDVGWTSGYVTFFGTSNLIEFSSGVTDTSGVTDMRHFMRDWTSMTTPPVLTSFNTANVTSMESMMREWSDMTTPPILTSFNTAKVTNMRDMMRNWSKMETSPNLTSFNTADVTRMDYMMYNWSSMTTTPVLTSFDTANVTNMYSMMLNWSSMTTPPDLTSFNTAKVINMGYMMFGWTEMGPCDPKISGWNIGAVESFSGFLQGSTLTTAAYDAVLANWSAQTLAAGASTTVIHFGNSKYTNSEPTISHRATLAAMCAGIIDGGTA